MAPKATQQIRARLDIFLNVGAVFQRTAAVGNVKNNNPELCEPFPPQAGT
jgi:hypothetical protein